MNASRTTPPSAWSWALYDFANSAFATTILAVVFNVYFVTHVVPPEGAVIFGRHVPGTALWGYLVSSSMLFILVAAPVLGAAADAARLKLPFLAAHWLPGAIAAGGLFFVRPGDVALAAILFTIANIGFAGGNIFYNALLPDVAPRERLGRVSGMGWAFGYLGGGLCLALNLLILRFPAAFGLAEDGGVPVRTCFALVGAWWFFFALPLARRGFSLPQRGMPGAVRLAKDAFSRLADTLRNTRRHPDLFKFLLAYVVYNEGIETIILMASVFGAKEIGMTQPDLVLCFLMIQGVALVGSLIFGRMADAWSHKGAILITLAVYACIGAAGLFIHTSGQFWVLGVAVGLVLGGSQAASRSLMALLTPPDRESEFFAFFGIVGKASAVVGPLVFGIVSHVAGLRQASAAMIVFFVLGAALLTAVREPGDGRGARNAVAG